MKLCCRSLFRRVQHVPDGTEVVGQMGEARQRTRQALLVPVFVGVERLHPGVALFPEFTPQLLPLRIVDGLNLP